MSNADDEAAWYAAYPHGSRPVTDDDVQQLAGLPIEEQFASMAREPIAWRARWIMGTITRVTYAAPSILPWIETAQSMARDGRISVDAMCYLASYLIDAEIERLHETDGLLGRLRDEMDAVADKYTPRQLDKAGGDIGKISPEWCELEKRRTAREDALLDLWLRENACSDVADLRARKPEFDERSHRGWAELLGDRPGAMRDPNNTIDYLDANARNMLYSYPLESFALDARDLNAEPGSDAIPVRWLTAAQLAGYLREAKPGELDKAFGMISKTEVPPPATSIWEHIGGAGTTAHSYAEGADILLRVGGEALSAGAHRVANSIAVSTRIALLERGPALVRGRAAYLQAQVLRHIGSAEQVHDTLCEALEDAIRGNSRELEATVRAELDASYG